jgi:hypothetical protein
MMQFSASWKSNNAGEKGVRCWKKYCEYDVPFKMNPLNYLKSINYS